MQFHNTEILKCQKFLFSKIEKIWLLIYYTFLERFVRDEKKCTGIEGIDD